jgi:hypothetical protein
VIELGLFILGLVTVSLMPTAVAVLGERRARERRALEAILACGRAALRACEVTRIQESRVWAASLSGVVDDLRVELEILGTPTAARMGVKVLPPRPWFLTLEMQPAAAGLGTLLGAPALRLGDDAFDATFRVGGPATPARAALDASTRAALLTLACETELSLTGSSLSVVIPAFDRGAVVASTLAAFEARLSGVASRCVAVARRLAVADDAAQRLAESVRTDPLVAVRRACLDELLSVCPQHAATAAALAQACRDVDPGLRLRAAAASGEAGRATLVALSRDAGLPDELCAQAVAALDTCLGLDEARAGMASAWAADRDATLRAYTLRLGSSGEPSALAPLLELLRLEEGSRAVLACEALARLGAPAAEPRLIDALRRREEAVAAAAARALGALGTIDAVGRLRELEEVARERTTRAAAREAVAAVQARASGAAPGQLSLASPEAGQLALGDDERGRVALVESDAGALATDVHAARRSRGVGPR